MGPDAGDLLLRKPMGIRERTEIAFEKWGRFVCRARWLVIALMALLTVSLASGMVRLTFEMSTESFLDPDDPERANYDAFAVSTPTKTPSCSSCTRNGSSTSSSSRSCGAFTKISRTRSKSPTR
jgi:hypothetical protein